MHQGEAILKDIKLIFTEPRYIKAKHLKMNLLAVIHADPKYIRVKHQQLFWQ